MNFALEQFQIATCLIQEGNRAAAALHIKAALRALDKANKRDTLGLRDELNKLLTMVQRNSVGEVV